MKNEILKDSILQFSIVIEATITLLELIAGCGRDRPLERLNHEKWFSENFFFIFYFSFYPNSSSEHYSYAGEMQSEVDDVHSELY